MKNRVYVLNLTIAIATHFSYGLVDQTTLLSWTDSYEEAYPGLKIPHVDAKTTRVLSFEKIVRATITLDGKDWVDYLLKLAQTEDEKEWEAFCSDLVYGSYDDYYGWYREALFNPASIICNKENGTTTDVPKEIQTAYSEYVYKKLVGAFHTQTHRQMIIFTLLRTALLWTTE